MQVKISLFKPDYPRWNDLLNCVEAEGQRRWLEFSFEHHLSSHVLGATQGDNIAGFLRFAVQQIGPPDDCPPLIANGAELTEAKILAFGVPERFRRQGIGAQLQQHAIHHARELGCHQIRSYSSVDHPENIALKLKLGFSLHPEQRPNGQQGYYFVLAL